MTTTRQLGGATRAAALLALLIAAAVAPAFGQSSSGTILVRVAQAGGQPVAAAHIVVSGPIEETRDADGTGAARLIDLPVGVYSIKATASGLAAATITAVELSAGTTARVTITLDAAGAPESIGPAPSPIADRSRLAVTTHVDETEFQNVPNARTAWALLQTVPTMYLDRVDVGGSEAADQSKYNAKGAQATDNTWSLDGVPITDMAATGASSIFFDVDAVRELAATTGGADVRSATGGVGVDVVLKRGGTVLHGSGRAFFDGDNALQAVNISSDLASALGNASAKGSRMDRYFDRGVELGGPLVRDRLWGWGSVAQTDVRLLTIEGDVDPTVLRSIAAKLDVRASANTRAGFTFYGNDRIKDDVGESTTRPAETAWQQSSPTRVYKGDASVALTSRLLASARAAYIDGVSQLVPNGGLDKDFYIDDRGVAHNTFFQLRTTRPQRFAAGDARYFAGRHELTFGGSWRSTPVDNEQTWPASHLVATWVGYPNLFVQAVRDVRVRTEATYAAAFLSDTIVRDRLTVTLGLRVDRQTSSLGDTSVPGVGGIAILPSVSAPAVPNVFSWATVTPRVGVTRVIGASGRNVIRASYAMFPSQLPGSEAAFVAPIQFSAAYYNAVDRNRDGVAQLAEVTANQRLQGFTGFDPANPTRVASVNRVDSGVVAPKTHEWMIGVDRAVSSRVDLTAAFTFRRIADLLWTPLTGVKSSDYAQAGSLTGNLTPIGAFTVPLYALRPTAVPSGGGETETNRPDYRQRFWGLEFGMTRRMSDRWRARLAFSTNDWREYFDNPATAILDPTRAPSPTLPGRPFAGPQIDGGSVVRQAGSRSAVYMVAPRYQIAANASYDGRWDLHYGVNLLARQGYAEPFFRSQVTTPDPLGRKTVLIASAVDDFRLDTITSLDARIEKRVAVARGSLAIDFDVFNVFNAATALARQYDARQAGATGFNQVLDIMNPRVARIGVRFTF